MKSGAKNTGGYSVTVSQGKPEEESFLCRTIYYSEPRENAIYRKSRNE